MTAPHIVEPARLLGEALDAVSTDWSRTFGQLTLVQFLSDRLAVGRSKLLRAVVRSFLAA